MKDNFIYEMPVYCGRTKVWRVLNLNTGTIYCMDFETMEKANESIEHNKKRARCTVIRIDLFDLRNKI